MLIFVRVAIVVGPAELTIGVIHKQLICRTEFDDDLLLYGHTLTHSPMSTPDRLGCAERTTPPQTVDNSTATSATRELPNQIRSVTDILQTLNAVKHSREHQYVLLLATETQRLRERHVVRSPESQVVVVNARLSRALAF